MTMDASGDARNIPALAYYIR